jgi:hypothetical protein
LQLALLADATDEGLMLVRQMDSEQFDLATLHCTVADFLGRLDFLFKQGGRMTVEDSFVRDRMSLLSAGQVQLLPHSTKAGQLRVLGPPSEEAVRRCISRMAMWAEMAKAAVEAEFPDFLVLNSFAVFALSDRSELWQKLLWTRPAASAWPSCSR